MRSRRYRLAGFLAIAAAVVAGILVLPVEEQLSRFLDWVRGLGPAGPLVLAAAYIPACILFVPGSLLTLGAGFAFGVVRGTLAVSLGSVLGVSAAFLLGRTLLRGAVEERVARSPKFRAIDEAVAGQGFKVVLLTRLSPLFPFNVLNYAYGLTKVRFRDYFLASWIGMLPGTVLYVYLGSAVGSVAELAAGGEAGGSPQKLLFFVGLAATAVVTVFVTRLARKALAAAVPAGSSPEMRVLEGAAHD